MRTFPALAVTAAAVTVIVLGSHRDGERRVVTTANASPQRGRTVPYANEILGRRNPSDSMAPPNTPQEHVAGAVKTVWTNGVSAIGTAVEGSKRTIHAGNDPTLNLIWDARAGNVEQMRNWLERGADPNAPDPYRNGDLETALMAAVRSGNPEAVGVLLPKLTDSGKKAQNRGQATALTIAQSMRNNASSVEDGKRMREIERMLQRAGVPDGR